MPEQIRLQCPEQASLFRPPDWRWRSALRLVDALTPSWSHEDPIVAELARFLIACRCNSSQRTGQRKPSAEPPFLTARSIWEENAPQRWSIEAHILAGEDDAAIADRHRVAATTVHWFTGTLFDVRDRLTADGWIMNQVVRFNTLRLGPNPDLGPLWRHAAYLGGPHALDAIIDASHDCNHQGWPFTPVPGETPLRRRVRRWIATLLLPADTRLPVLLELAASQKRMARFQAVAQQTARIATPAGETSDTTESVTNRAVA